MIEVWDKETKAPVGKISDAQLKFLIDQLVEEHPTDQDYYINRSTLEMFVEKGADEELMKMLRGALGDRKAMEIQWERG